MARAKKATLFPDLIHARVEYGLPKAVDEAARRQRTTRAEYVRQVLRRALEADGVDLPPLAVLETAPGSSRPRSGSRAA